MISWIMFDASVDISTDIITIGGPHKIYDPISFCSMTHVIMLLFPSIAHAVSNFTACMHARKIMCDKNKHKCFILGL